MKTKEAIKLIQEIEEDGRNVTSKHIEALVFAIKALMAYRDCKHCIHKIKVNHMYGCEVGVCEFEEVKE